MTTTKSSIRSLLPSATVSVPEDQVVAIQEKTTTILTASSVDPNSPHNTINTKKFWLWSLFAFFVPFFLVFGILAGVNPPITQTVDNLNSPTGQQDYLKIAGAAAVAGMIAIIIFVLVVLGRPERFQKIKNTPEPVAAPVSIEDVIID